MADNSSPETSFKPLTVSSKPCEVSTLDQEAALTNYAAARARLLFGSYRKGEANDPDTYVAAITAVLARYPEDVIRAVTHPAQGLPIKTDFLPTVKEVYKACEELVSPRREAVARKKRVEKQLAERVPERPVYPRDSDEAKAVRILHDLVGRTSAFFTIFRRDDGSVTFSKPMTEQLVAISRAPASADWVVLSHRHAGAWEALLRKVFDDGLVRQRLHEGSRAPWPWPPSINGTLYPDADGPAPLTEEDAAALAPENQN